MEETDLLKMAGISTTGVAIILIIYRILKTVQGKKLVSSCCGKKIEVGVAVAPMTPVKTDEDKDGPLEIYNPMPERSREKKTPQ